MGAPFYKTFCLFFFFFGSSLLFLSWKTSPLSCCLVSWVRISGYVNTTLWQTWMCRKYFKTKALYVMYIMNKDCILFRFSKNSSLSFFCCCLCALNTLWHRNIWNNSFYSAWTCFIPWSKKNQNGKMTTQQQLLFFFQCVRLLFLPSLKGNILTQNRKIHTK